MKHFLMILLLFLGSFASNAETKQFQATWEVDPDDVVTIISVAWEKNGTNAGSSILSGTATSVVRNIDVANGDTVTATVIIKNDSGDSAPSSGSVTASGVAAVPQPAQNMQVIQVN